MKAPLPENQAVRLQALEDLAILDTGPEQAFDDVVALASRICEMPISLISLVDADRQWFKAKVGMDAEETSIEKAICAHAIAQDDFLEIPDTRADARTADNPLVTGDDNLRFYAGALLRDQEGLALGTLCVLDTKPNQLNDLQRETLRVLARQVVTQMELRRALEEAELLRHEVDHRVKNSLQSVAALTRVQARMAGSEETREALDLVRRRIDTIALMHQQLYTSSSDGSIQMADFVPRVADLLQQTAPEGIRIETAVAPITLPSSRAAAVGVILNEFASNAYKHAFEGQVGGVIRFEIAQDGPDHAWLDCSDNGRGIDLASPRHEGLGLRIIEASAQQLGGVAETSADAGGTRTRVRIDLEDNS